MPKQGMAQSSQQFASPVYRAGGGLNVRSSANQLMDNECTAATNVIFDDRGSIQGRAGITKYRSSAVPTSGNLIGVGQAAFVNVSTGVITRLVLATDGTKVYYDNAGTWTDITGAVSMSPGSQTVVQYLMMTNLIIGYDGTNVPYKWTGSGNIAVLGGSPPTGNISIVWNNYLWYAGIATAPSRIYASDLGNAESWPSTNFFDVPTPNDGEPITGLAVLYGNMIIFKRNSIYIMQGTSITNFTLSKLNSSWGCVGPYAYKQVDNLVYFVSDKGLYAMNLFNNKHISYAVEPRYRNAVANNGTTSLNLNKIMLAHYKKRNQIWALVDATAAGQNTHDRIIVHDYLNVAQKQGAPGDQDPLASEFSFATTASAPSVVADFYSTTTGIVVPIFSMYDKYVYYYDETVSQDDTNNYTMTYTTKYFDFGDPFIFKNFRFFRSVANVSNTSTVFKVTYSNDIGVSSTTISYTPGATSFWDTRGVVPNTVNFPLLAKYFQFTFQYTGQLTWIIYEFQCELIKKGRRL